MVEHNYSCDLEEAAHLLFHQHATAFHTSKTFFQARGVLLLQM